MKIAAHAAFEVDGFANVQNLPILIRKAVNAGQVGQVADDGMRVEIRHSRRFAGK